MKPGIYLEITPASTFGTIGSATDKLDLKHAYLIYRKSDGTSEVIRGGLGENAKISVETRKSLESSKDKLGPEEKPGTRPSRRPCLTVFLPKSFPASTTTWPKKLRKPAKNATAPTPSRARSAARMTITRRRPVTAQVSATTDPRARTTARTTVAPPIVPRPTLHPEQASRAGAGPRARSTPACPPPGRTASRSGSATTWVSSMTMISGTSGERRTKHNGKFETFCG